MAGDARRYRLAAEIASGVAIALTLLFEIAAVFELMMDPVGEWSRFSEVQRRQARSLLYMRVRHADWEEARPNQVPAFRDYLDRRIAERAR